MVEKAGVKRPNVSGQVAHQELEKVDRQLQNIQENIKEVAQEGVPEGVGANSHQETRISNREAQRKDAFILKPRRVVFSQEKFNEKWRKAYEFAKERVNFIAEHKECPGDGIEMWTKCFPGTPAEEWAIPTGIVVNGPRYLAESIKKARYARLTMKQEVVNKDSVGAYYGAIAVEEIKQRLDAFPVSDNPSIFIGASNF